ncbi:hypothetical protein BpHYR1_046071 [Brachionus plicatilis]|uniref:FLYWCH-type domain-containing protein n=1 Tax=Brachionus plicatilis TaxID=10195 RepID=A0A3M7SR95_BRAPC|nr:hypothetical protein BpHYR1_046071 [Brachionus plicatilis]
MDSIEELANNFERSLNMNKGFISMSQKKAPQLHFDGQFYRINGKSNKVGKINWRCIVAKCTGSCSTYGATIGEELFTIYENINFNLIILNTDVDKKETDSNPDECCEMPLMRK